MRFLRVLILLLFTVCMLYSQGAYASSLGFDNTYNGTVTDDLWVDMFTPPGAHSNYGILRTNNFFPTASFVKFNMPTISSQEKIVALEFRLFNIYSEPGSFPGASYLNYDNWNETQGINTNNPALFMPGNMNPMQQVAYGPNGWNSWMLELNNLSDPFYNAIINQLSDNTVSFALNAEFPQPLDSIFLSENQFLSKDYSLQNVVIPDLQLFAQVFEAPPGAFAPQLLVHTINANPVPEPSTMLLGLLGLGGARLIRRKK